MQVNLELSSLEENYHPNDEVTLLNENPEIFRKAPPIRPRGDEHEEVKERKRKRQRVASNRMGNQKENEDKDIPEEWTTANSRIEPGQDAQFDQNSGKNSSFSEACSSATGGPILNWTTHVVSSVPQLTSSAKMYVKARNG